MQEHSSKWLFDAKGCFVVIASLIAAYICLVLGIDVVLTLARSALQQSVYGEALERDRQILFKILIDLVSPIVLTITALLIVARYFPASSWIDLLKKFGFERTLQIHWVLVSFLFGVAVILFIKWLMAVFPSDPVVDESSSAIVEGAQVWVQLVIAINLVTIVPIAEEFIFRGLLYKGFALSWNKLVAAALVSVFFTLAHIDALRDGYWVSQLALCAISVVLISAREFTGSLYSSIMIHSGFNFGSVFIVLHN